MGDNSPIPPLSSQWVASGQRLKGHRTTLQLTQPEQAAPIKVFLGRLEPNKISVCVPIPNSATLST